MYFWFWPLNKKKNCTLMPFLFKWKHYQQSESIVINSQLTYWNMNFSTTTKIIWVYFNQYLSFKKAPNIVPRHETCCVAGDWPLRPELLFALVLPLKNWNNQVVHLKSAFLSLEITLTVQINLCFSYHLIWKYFGDNFSCVSISHLYSGCGFLLKTIGLKLSKRMNLMRERTMLISNIQKYKYSS